MALNIDEIESLPVSSFGDEYWNKTVDNIIQNFNQIIKNNVQEKYLQYPIDIDFLIGLKPETEIENDPNAYAKKISENKYEIVIGKKLLILLRHFSYKIIDYNLIFPELKRNEKNAKILTKVSDTVFYFWIDFICLHEWSHIIKGHVDYKYSLWKNSQTFYEFNTTSNINANDIYLELDADRFAGKISFGRFALSFNELTQHIESNNEKLIYNFSIGMLYLFDLFYMISNQNKNTSHPLPIYRMSLLLTSYAEVLHLKNDILDIYEDKFFEITQKAIMRFTLEYGNEYNLIPEKLMKEFPTFIEEYFSVIKSINLKQYQILKTEG